MQHFDIEEQEQKNDEFVVSVGWCIGMGVVILALVAFGAWFTSVMMSLFKV